MGKNGKHTPALRQAVKDAYEAGRTWSELEAMGPSKGTISRWAKADGWDRNGKRVEQPAEQPVEQVEQRDDQNTGRARVQVDTDLIEEHYQQWDVLEETLLELERHARFGKAIENLAEGLIRVVQGHITEKLPDGTRRVKKHLDMSAARQAAGLLEQLGKAGEKGINIYRKSRGIYDKQQHEHSGRIDGPVKDTLAAHLGLALQGNSERSSALSAEIPGGHETPEIPSS